MSSFKVSAVQRAQLLAGNHDPLDFDVKPFGCEEGARYVLARQPARKFPIREKDEDARVLDVVDIPAMDIWFITVTAVQRHRKGFWRVRFDVTDLRDPTVYLKAGSGYTTSRRGAVDPLPVVVDDQVREKAREEFWHARRLARFADEQRAKSRARRQRRAA